jgi:hypothetical protein
MNDKPTPAELFLHCNKELLRCLELGIYGGVYQNAKECFYAVKKLNDEVPSLYRRG